MEDHGLAQIDGKKIQILDICEQHAVEQIVAQTQPEVIFHLAAQPLVRASYQNPIETLHTNILGTAYLLDAVRHCDTVQAVVNVTSDKCYENREWPWPYREHEAMGGFDPYSASKGCSELVTASYRRSFFEGERTIGLASGRAGNVIGGGDWATDRLIPDIIRSLIDRQPVVLRNPLAIRPWQHVLEALSGYLMLGARLLEDPTKYAGGWNFGPNTADAVNVRTLATQTVKVWGSGEVAEEPNGSALHEANYLKIDSSKALHELNWLPLLSAEERIAWTVSWYRDWCQDRTSGGELIAQQVTAYHERFVSYLNQRANELSPTASNNAAANAA